MIPRINLQQEAAVVAQRNLGRTDRQIEKIVGLPNGFLSRPYLLDDSIEREIDRQRAAYQAWVKRDDRFQAAQRIPQRPQGWRPRQNCITDRPDSGKHFIPRRAD